MSIALTVPPKAQGAGHGRRAVQRFLAALGRATRRRCHFILMIASLAFGVISSGVRPNSWRRTVRSEFRRALHQTIAGGLSTTLVCAALVGVGMVYQALYWLGIAGQPGFIGLVLVAILVRAVAPLLVGFILLGRSGMVAVAEIGGLTASGKVHALEAQGMDPFLFFVLPRACAFALAAFALGIVFVLVALLSGFIAGSLFGNITISFWSLFDGLTAALLPADYAVFPAKMLLIGLLVALTACVTSFEAIPGEDPARLMPRGFVRGVLAVLLISITLSLAI
jgi:phospholipid/cholesterol/gamma-HCH transport system permease protein